MKTLIAIDPGTTESAFLKWDGEKLGTFGTISNESLLESLRGDAQTNEIFIEMVACYGMPVGKETFETCLWIGRFIEAWERPQRGSAHLLYRQAIKLHHCGTARAKDGNVRQAIIDKYGAVGTKKAPGRLYGISGHLWQAFAIAAYVTERRKTNQPL